MNTGMGVSARSMQQIVPSSTANYLFIEKKTCTHICMHREPNLIPKPQHAWLL